MRLINIDRATPAPVLPIDQNNVPLVLTPAWQDLHAGYLINVQDTTSLGIWLHLTGAAGFKVRIQATYDKDSNDYYNLPIKSPTSTVVGLEFEEYEFINATGEVKLVFSAVTADVLNFLKIQVQGVGTIQKAFVTAKGRI